MSIDGPMTVATKVRWGSMVVVGVAVVAGTVGVVSVDSTLAFW